MKKVLLASLIAASFSAHAQYMGTVPPNVDARFFYSEDTDKFRVTTAHVGAAHKSGVGARIGYTNYQSPNLSTNSEFMQFTYVDIGDNYDFHGAFGVRNTDASPNPVVAGDAELRLTMTDSLTFGLSVATDSVESERGILNGTTYATVAGDMDLQLSDNLNLGAIVGITHFSDDNDRFFAKSKLTWTVLPKQGVSVFATLMGQTDTNAKASLPAEQRNYYSPDSLIQSTVGAQIRKPYNGMVYLASVEYGYRIASVSGSGDETTPVYVWVLGAQTNPGRKTGITYGVSLTGSNVSLSSANGGNYNWYGLNSWIKVPF
jgi:hypothetical protein